ncbi:hypothetical protein [Synechococcus phage MA10]|uniref:NUMOD4 domain-containing protein n=1 Tax=Synechococcus phage S-H34 TaxID=2718942 RepID=A0A6G8R6K0_9CAUD|nr:hypothetical protein PQC15_gp160 [Synechococcus phage S-H34]QIN97031.1 hypothetical protein [Synechococcus phage S-H34]
MELWKPISGFPLYEVSTLGKVRSIKTGKLLSSRSSILYYSAVTLRQNGKPKHRWVHTLVGRNFLEGYEDGLFILHKDETLPNPEINYLDNLFLGTKKDNIRDAIKKGRNKPHFSTRDNSGENNYSAVLGWTEVRMIRHLHSEGRSALSLSKEYGVGYGTVYRIVHRHTWKE